MVAVRTLLLIAIAAIFIIVALVMAARVKGGTGSLRLAKINVVLAALSSAGSFISEIATSLNYQNEVLVKQLYVFVDLFAMLVLAFLASFAVIATYAGPGRRYLLILFFALALIPPLYLVTSYNEAQILGIIEPEVLDLEAPPLTYPLYAIIGIPLGLVPLVVFARSVMTARKRGDHLLASRAALMLSAIGANEVAYLIYAFGSGIVELAALVAWIPAALLLMYAVLKITASV